MIKVKSRSFFQMFRANRVLGITLFPFIIYKDRALELDQTFWRHEAIHFRQQLEMLIIPFYLWYGIEFIFRYIQFRDWDLAYRNLSFEREAYGNEECEDYLKKRKLWAFVNYLNRRESN